LRACFIIFIASIFLYPLPSLMSLLSTIKSLFGGKAAEPTAAPVSNPAQNAAKQAVKQAEKAQSNAADSAKEQATLDGKPHGYCLGRIRCEKQQRCAALASGAGRISCRVVRHSNASRTT
jgi:hypothetical protein